LKDAQADDEARMEPTPAAVPVGPSTAQRERLARLIADPALEGPRLLAKLRELRALEGIDVFSAALETLMSVRWPEARAEEFLLELVRNRADLVSRLGRDPGLAVAATDLLASGGGALDNPVFVEWSERGPGGRRGVADPLTGLQHRKSFVATLVSEIRRCERGSAPMALVVADLDSFGSVNELYGHPLGDHVLRRCGRTIRRTVRDSDVAWRLDGDEFAVILPRTRQLGGWAAAERLREAVERAFAEKPVEGRIVGMTVSCGVSCFPEDGETAAGLLRSARQGAERAKVRGRNRVMVRARDRRASVRLIARPTTRARVSLGQERGLRDARLLDLGRSGAMLEVDKGAEEQQRALLVLEAAGSSTTMHGRVTRAVTEGGAEQKARLAMTFDERLAPAIVRVFATTCGAGEIGT